MGNLNHDERCENTKYERVSFHNVDFILCFFVLPLVPFCSGESRALISDLLFFICGVPFATLFACAYNKITLFFRACYPFTRFVHTHILKPEYY